MVRLGVPVASSRPSKKMAKEMTSRVRLKEAPQRDDSKWAKSLESNEKQGLQQPGKATYREAPRALG